jgi:hypothetical protein
MQEEQRDKWRQIKKATGYPQLGATNLVQCMEGKVGVNILEAGAMNERDTSRHRETG